MAWNGIEWYLVEHYRYQWLSRSIIRYSICILIYIICQLEICYISGGRVTSMRARVLLVSDTNRRFSLSKWHVMAWYDIWDYISGRWLLHIWTMEVTYLGECYISGRWRLHVWTIEVTYLYLDECYINGQEGLHIWTSVTYLDNGGYMSRWLRLHIGTVTYLYITRGLDNIRYGIYCVRQVSPSFLCGKK